MSHVNPVYVIVSKDAVAHLLRCAEMVDDFHELRAAAAAVKKSMAYTEECAALERLMRNACDEK